MFMRQNYFGLVSGLDRSLLRRSPGEAIAPLLHLSAVDDRTVAGRKRPIGVPNSREPGSPIQSIRGLGMILADGRPAPLGDRSSAS
jgi:hypothetical protein